MIWNSSHVCSAIIQKPEQLQQLVKKIDEIDVADKESHYISIIGGGPKGFYALTQFLTLCDRRGLNTNVQIHWFNSNPNFGSGPHYQPDLPDYLLLNQCIADVNCWEEEEWKLDEEKHASLKAWIQKHKTCNQTVQNEDLCTRELFGRYLIDSLLSILQAHKSNIRIHLIQGKIEDISLTKKYIKLTANQQVLPYKYQSILLATGHSFQNIIPEAIINNASSEVSYISEPYPLQQLDHIRPKSEVAIRGIGLSFIDVMLYLTEGRGGIFYKNDQELKYLPSGNEPILFPFSKTNLPILPNNIFWKDQKYQPKFFTNEFIEQLLATKKTKNFQKDIFPTLDLEVKYAFYSRLEHLVDAPEEEILKFIEERQDDERFTINALTDPISYSRVSPEANFNEFITDLSIYCLRFMDAGELFSPMSTALAAVRESFFQMRKLYNFSNLKGKSQEKFDQDWLGPLTQLALGPARINVEKFFCLLTEGYIKFIYYEEPEVSVLEDKICIKSNHVEKTFDYLIEARVAKLNLRMGNCQLINKLYQKKIIRELVNGSYHTGKIAINKNGKLKQLTSNHLIYLYGTPTEGAVLHNDHLCKEKNNFAYFWALKTIQKIENNFPKELISVADFTVI
ncbi:FAD/NAD(P)-binding protein [Sphingobacterium sp. HJSM2_6]|uniref:FAD/NAD(P)-binding protein n=1 Tax=Sphingobacterium sp. HJSM2_6 TaxID=3366264 RepID=UPI003BE2D1E0